MSFEENPYHTPSHMMGDFAKDLNPTESKPKSKEFCSEITVTIKDDEKTLKTKTLVYENYTVNEDDPVIAECISLAMKEFHGEATDIKVRINLTVL